MAAAAYGGIFTASNSGTAWVSNNVPWQIADGEIVTATNSIVETQGLVWSSNNVPAQDWSALHSSPDGNTLLALARSGWSYKSTNGGATWTPMSTPYDFWQCVASSASGSNLLAASHFGFVYQSTNAGGTWTPLAIVLDAANVTSTNTFSYTVIYTNANTRGIVTNTYAPVATLPVLTLPNNLV
ncbi:MAG: hypothetical protein WB421_14250, partial [Terriglobales bacterium]